ncbi:MAG TPA: Minf_1886 family protein [Verrucomicrobiae bacterium]|jgi:uncharacterized repeat protein (TIGR04138 family)
MQELNFDEVLDALVARDKRYKREAYLFLREALDFTQKMMAKGPKEEMHHVTGQELLAGIRAFGLQQYGPMTLTVLGDWGVHACEDFGEIVFNMVECSLLAKTEKDTRADFKGAYTFNEAFQEPFLPKTRARVEFVPEAKSTQV